MWLNPSSFFRSSMSGLSFFTCAKKLSGNDYETHLVDSSRQCHGDVGVPPRPCDCILHEPTDSHCACFSLEFNFIWIRRGLSDDVQRYHLADFVPWWVRFRTDPLTGEDLSHLAKWVERAVELDRLLTLKQETNAWLSPYYRVGMLSLYLQDMARKEAGQCLTEMTETDRKLARLLLTPDDWKRCQLMHDLTPQQASQLLHKEAAPGAWLLRTSVVGGNQLMPNSRCVTVSFKTRLSNGTTTSVKHSRLIEVDGVGWFWGNCADHLQTFAAFVDHKKTKQPVCATFAEMLDLIMAKHHFRWSTLIRGERFLSCPGRSDM